jgi:hypothetical protein
MPDLYPVEGCAGVVPFFAGEAVAWKAERVP